ncbi:MAG: DNA-binding response regulator [Caulobacteraceae bacterium]|nr:DNA-binding response regulator [Caulobacteraceae bacterium]
MASRLQIPNFFSARREAYGRGMKLLIVEDDKEAGAFLKRALTEAGHNVDLAQDGRDGLLLAGGEVYDVIVLDRMLPGLDGLGLLQLARGAGVKTPVLMLTAIDGIDDRVAGLQAGADDYLVKPYALAELSARLEALARRPPPREVQTELKVADLHIDLLSRRVARAGRRIELQPKEFQLLEQLMRGAGTVVTRTMLLEKVWNFHFDPRTNIVETHLSRLRRKIEPEGSATLIHTVRGAGYCMREPE